MTTARMAVIGLVGTVLLAGIGCGEDSAKVADLEAQLAALEADRQRLVLEVRDATEREASAATGLAGLQDQMADATARLKDLTGQIDSAKLIATTAQAQYEEAAGKLAAAETKITELQGSLDQAAEDAAAVAEQYRLEIEALRTQIRELQTQLDAAVKALGDGNGLRQLLPK